MSLKKRCIVGDSSLPNQLEFINAMSISIGKIPMMMYYCNGDNTHIPHFVRIDYGEQLSTRNRKGIVIPLEQRKRIIEHQKQLRCVIGKCKMKYLKTETDKLGEESVDIYRCSGTRRGHHSHIVRITQGMITDKLGMIVFTIEK